MDDFFRHMQPDNAIAIEALARRQYELRESEKAVLASVKAVSLEQLQADLATTPSAEGERAFICGSALRQEGKRVRETLVSLLRGLTDTVDTNPNSMLMELITQRYAKCYPNGAIRCLDGIELIDVKGIMLCLRFVTPTCWEARWSDDGKREWSLSRWSAQVSPVYRVSGSPEKTSYLHTLPDGNDLRALAVWLLDMLAEGPATGITACANKTTI
ncbi:hypothetical protein [Laribacter hongkongensis]|uniref:Uncharacterized protein n=1 Tax=Laribacter hongkongensis TaxID=168471 RepID=A0A248LHU1_9NEIS|nr:hypothetical protein [Laribacter hongkongensis]ASJ24350.1 hypothetical protein LHGZ1_1519 [Laribacter hongkongensis]MCG9042044.1 hypothetical protein [Laribacter hongkongensis]MCG9069224.1 hypothetical protein [Laribacter hongkongensis]MCG9087887.1 hypothetical protein [Laribacter hongkongensis]MCG9110968.1 hypothetical protein [Laribacter hongkongensis]